MVEDNLENKSINGSNNGTNIEVKLFSSAKQPVIENYCQFSKICPSYEYTKCNIQFKDNCRNADGYHMENGGRN